MEFKFRAEDHKPPSYRYPSSMGFPSSLRAGFPSVIPVSNIDQMPPPKDAGEEILRELEKEQIRREIISGELARRRMLEEEVRRELMVEREMALRRNLEEKLSFEERVAMGFNHRLNVIPPPYGNRSFEEPNAFPSSKGFNSLLNMHRFPQLVGPEIKPAPGTNKDKLIILAKPEPDHYGEKRKAVTPPAVDGGEQSPFGLKKKSKEDWSCALCQVSVTSARGLNEHLHGKKHKAKESALRMQKIGKSITTTAASFSSKESVESVKPTETIVTTTSGLDAKADGWSLEGISQTVEVKTEERLVPKDQKPKNSKEQNGSAKEEAGKKKAVQRKRKFKFWCEVCRVGSFSQTVMESHKKGKKHIKRLKFCQNDGSHPPTSTMLSEATPLTKDADTANIETNQKTISVLSKETNMKMAEAGFPNSVESSSVAESSGDRVVGEEL